MHLHKYYIILIFLSRRPIIACWYVALADYVVHHPVAPGPVDAKSTAPSPIQTCRLIINHSVWETMMFPDPGEFVFVANFYNNASQANGTISFKVFQSEFVSSYKESDNR